MNDIRELTMSLSIDASLEGFLRTLSKGPVGAFMRAGGTGMSFAVLSSQEADVGKSSVVHHQGVGNQQTGADAVQSRKDAALQRAAALSSVRSQRCAVSARRR